jgi:hypothetical protein
MKQRVRDGMRQVMPVDPMDIRLLPAIRTKITGELFTAIFTGNHNGFFDPSGVYSPSTL